MNRYCKRLLDIVMSVCGLVVAAPLMALIAGALWLEAPGSVIFAQERLGKNGRPFRLYKFRKFAPDIGTKGTGVTVAGDARMTPIGRLLERTKLDELPQLWNILKGEMSFVGPRPETSRFADLFQGEFAQVLDYTPGIFGPNQIAYRNESAMYPPDENPESFYRRELFPAKARNDLAYFSRANCLSDLRWIIQGIWVSLIGVADWKRLASMHLKIMLVDALMIAAAWAAAWMIRYGFLHMPDREVLFEGWLMVIPVMLTGLMLGGCYAHPLRSFSIADATRLIVVASFGWLLAFLLMIGFIDRGMSMMLAPLGWLCVIPALMAPRVIRRLNWERKTRQDGAQEESSPKVIIYGANPLGECLARWAQSELPQCRIIGFMDNRSDMLGKRLNGYRVIGRAADLAVIHERHQPNEIWLASPMKGDVALDFENQAGKLDIRLVRIIDLDPFRRSMDAQIYRFPQVASGRKGEDRKPSRQIVGSHSQRLGDA